MPDLTQIIELGATVVVVGLFLWYNFKRDKRFTDIISNHLNHSTETQTELKDSIKELLTFLRSQNGK